MTLGACLLALGLVNVLQTFVASVSLRQKLAVLPFASIPIGFGAQQIAEGFVWQSNLANQDAIRCFTFFAFPFWPFFVPFSMLLLELTRPQTSSPMPQWGWTWTLDSHKTTSPWRRALQVAIFIIGFVVALYCAAALIESDPVKAYLSDWRIAYDVHFPRLMFDGPDVARYTAFMLYVVAVHGALLVSSVAHTGKFAVMVAVSLSVAFALWSAAFASTWCFFSAGLSAVLIWIANQELRFRQQHTKFQF